MFSPAVEYMIVALTPVVFGVGFAIYVLIDQAKGGSNE